MKKVLNLGVVLLLAFILVSCTTTEFEVTFDVNGGTPTINSQTIDEDSNVTRPDDPSKDGFTFEGWYEREEKEEFDFSTPVTKDIDLVAKWSQLKEEVTIVFDLGYGKDSKLSEETIDKNGIVNKPNDPVREDYEFLGWALSTDLKKMFDFQTEIKDDITLIAQWEEVVELEVEDVSLISPTKTVFYSGEDLNLNGGQIKVVYNNDEVDYIDLEMGMVNYEPLIIGTQDVSVTVNVLEKDYNFNYQITIKENFQVSNINSELKEQLIRVEGIYVGVNATGAIGGEEVLIKDLTTNDVIGIRSFLGTLPYGLSQGDEVAVFVTVNVSEVDGEIGKTYLTFSDTENSTDINDIIVSQDNLTDFDLSEAVIANNQDDLIDFFTNRADNFYKILKVSGTLYGNRYGKEFDNAYYRMHMLDDGRWPSIKVAGNSFALKSNYANFNTNASVQDLIFSDTAEDDPSYPGAVFVGDVYFIYTGGNAYYHQVTVLDKDHIQPLSVEDEKVNAVNELNAYINALTEEDYREEDWTLITQTYLNEGTTNINASETVLEVEAALTAIKDKIDLVLKVSVKEVTLVSPTKTTYYINQTFSLEGGKIKVVYNDDEFDYIDLDMSMITYDPLLTGVQNVSVNINVLEEEYNFTYEITVKENLQVSNILPTLENELVRVEGIYVGVNATGNTGGEEVLIKDLSTNNVIGIRSFLGELPYGLTQGDKLELFAEVNVSGANGEVGKTYLTFSETENSTNINDLIVSQGNLTDLDLSQAVIATNQDDLINFFTNRADNFYKILKVSGTLYGNRYGSNFDKAYYRMQMLENGTFNSMKIDGKSFALRSNYANFNTNASVQDLIFSDTAETPASYPGAEFNGDIYFLYTGGNSYYHQVTVLDVEHIQPTVVGE